jgi:hypothetical protein
MFFILNKNRYFCLGSSSLEKNISYIGITNYSVCSIFSYSICSMFFYGKPEYYFQSYSCSKKCIKTTEICNRLIITYNSICHSKFLIKDCIKDILE